MATFSADMIRKPNFCDVIADAMACENATVPMMISCALCGTPVVKRCAAHRYCEPCSSNRRAEQQRAWATKHHAATYPANREHCAAARRTITDATREAGVANTERQPIWVDMGQPIDLLWYVRIQTPFDYSLSKNAIWRTSRHGHTYLRREAAASQIAIGILVRKAIREAGVTVVQNKLWIDLFVQKPNNRGDAINVIDLVCDGLKEAVGLDDRWFAIRRLDWEITKDRPSVYIGVGQDTDQPVIACSCCGRLLAPENFANKKDGPLGRERTCRKCRSDGRRIASEKRRAMRLDDDERI